MTLIRNHHSFLLILFLLTALISVAQEDWVLKKDKDGIKVFVLEDDQYEFNPYKSVVVMDGDILHFKELMWDSPRMKEWSESVKHVEILKVIGDSIQIYYSIANAPFPIKNRDGIYQNTFRWLKENLILRIDVLLLPDYIPFNNECERVSGMGYWQIEEIEPGKIQVVCEMRIDPGGSIPAWLANAFADENPYKNMMRIRELIKSDMH